MLRFIKKRLKKYRKSSRKPATLENSTHQTTDIVADYGGDSDGEYLEREISPIGLMRTWGQISTTESVLGSQHRTGGLEVNSFL